MVTMHDIATATFDTNVFPAEPLIQRAARAGIAVGVVSVSAREVEGSTLEQELAALQSVDETGVYGESRYGQAVYASRDDANRLEGVLAVLSNRSFPRQGNREILSDGQRRQLRDSMILCAHILSGRDVLVSNDRRAFIENGRREEIASTWGATLMTVPEFEHYVSEREHHAV
jgi:hypothetical protein